MWWPSRSAVRTSARAGRYARPVDEAASINGRVGIQVHGGMGFTWEVPAHLFAKRAWVLANAFGLTDARLDTVAAEL